MAVPCLADGDSFVTELERLQLATMLAENLASLSDGSRYFREFALRKAQEEAKGLDFLSDNSESYNVPFTMRELSSALSMCGNTAPGPDDVHYDMLRHLSHSAFSLLLQVYNTIWISGTFPESWKEAVVLAFPKPGKDSSKANNYRPISLTSSMCKLMEKMVNVRLMWYLELNNIIHPAQFGFRKMRSTTDLLVLLENAIRNAFGKKHHLVAVFFDIEKAYDTTWKFGIMMKLHSCGM